jgi:ribose-phosphate pyrophosphokinase
MLANLMKVAGVNHVITIDLHASQMQGFFKCPVDNLVAEPLLAKWIRLNIPDWPDAVVVSKNAGGTKRVTSLADALKLSFGIITTDRRRPHPPGSMYSSFVFEAMGTDGTNDRRALEIEEEEAETKIMSSGHIDSMTRGQDFALGPPAISSGIPFRPSRHHTPTTNSDTNGNLSPPTSIIAQSSRLDFAAPAENDSSNSDLSRQPQEASNSAKSLPDDDGYEEPEGDEDTDEVCLT